MKTTILAALFVTGAAWSGPAAAAPVPAGTIADAVHQLLRGGAVVSATGIFSNRDEDDEDEDDEDPRPRWGLRRSEMSDEDDDDVDGDGGYYVEETAEPEAAPAEPARIRIINPESTGAEWSYLINGETQKLPAGYAQELTETCVIEFDRGGSAGTVRYSLGEGTYTFTFGESDQWDLLRTEYTEMPQVASDEAAEDDGSSAAPVVAVNIRITNPEGNDVEWSYLIDGQLQKLPAGYAQEWTKPCTIEFDRGGSGGPARQDLTSGTYAFTPKENDQWDLVRVEEQADTSVAGDSKADAAHESQDPVTDEERQMFQAMYANAGLEPADLETLQQHWQASTHAGRKQEYDEMMKALGQTPALPAASQETAASGTPAAESGESVTDDERRMFQTMYGDAGLEPEDLKTLQQHWAGISHAERKREYEEFAEKVNEARAAR